MSAQAAAYYWVGGATGAWNNADNWASTLNGTGGAGIPGTDPSDIVNLPCRATISVTSNVQIAELLIPNPNQENSSFSVTLTGSNTLTVTSKIETFRPTGAGTPDNATSTLIFDCNLVCNETDSKMIMHSGGNITIAEGKTANIKTIENQGEADPQTLLTVSGTLLSTSISLSNVNTRKISVSSTGKISTGSLTGTTGSVTNAGLIVTQDTPDTGLITSSGTGTSTVAAAGTFVWTGDTDNNWTVGTNWLGGTAPTASDTTAVINIPKVSRQPEIPSGTSLSFATDNLTIDTDANITVNGELELTGTSSTFDLSKIKTNSSGSLSVNGTLSNSTDYSASGLALSCGTLTSTNSLTCKSLSVSGETTFTSDSNLTLETSGTSALSFGDTFTQNGTGDLTINSSGNVTFSAATQVNSLAISASGKDVTFSDTISSSSSLSVTADNLSFASTATVNDITISATTSTGSNMTVTGNWTNNGVFTASGGTVTFTTANSDTTYADLTGSGTNNFNDIEIQRNIYIRNDITAAGNFTANRKASDTHMGGRNIMFANGKKLTVNGNIDLKGRANTGGNRLRLCGINIDSDTWELECNGSTDIEFVNFKGCAATPTLQTKNCTDSGGNSGFLFPGQTYKWVGGESGHETEWNRSANWEPNTVPSAGASIEIQAVALALSPVLTANLNLLTTIDSTNYGSITIDEGATFDIAGYDLTLVSITNEGTLRLTGEQTITGALSNGTADSATVEYYGGTGTLSNFVWDGGSSTDKAYTNLTISRDVSISDKISVSGKTIINADANLTNTANSFSSTGKVKIGDYSSTPKIQAGAVTLYSGAAVTIDDAAYAQSFTAYCPVIIHDITTTGTQTYHDDVTLSQSGNTTFTAQNASNVYQTIDFKKDILISGTGSKNLILNSNTTISNAAATIESDIQTQTGTSFTPSTETTTFKGNLLFADSTVSASSGTIVLTAENVTGSEAELRGSNTFNELKIQNSAKITGSNSIAALTVDTEDGTTGLGGKQITFTAATTQTISGTLTLKGSSTTSRLQLRSSSTGSQWKISCGSSDIKFVDIKDSENESTDYLFALNSNDSGNNTKWNFPGMEYTWTGATTITGKQNDWNTSTNWSPASIPGSGAVITIDAVSNHPILTQPLNIKTTISGTDFGTIQVAAGATFDLADQNLTAISITNNGTVRLFGSQTIDAAMSNGTSTNSTVEYYITGTGSTLGIFAWDGGSSTEKAYTNLTISRDVSISDIITVSGKTIINADANLTNTANSFSSTGKIKIGDYSSTPKIQAGDVTLYSGAAITIDDAAYAQSIAIHCPVNIHDVTTTGAQTYYENVTLTQAGNTTFTAKNASNVYQTIDFKKDILVSGTGSKKLILNSNTTISNAAATIEPDIQTQAGTNFAPSSGTTTFKGNLLFADSTVNTSFGIIVLTAENTTGSEAELCGSNTFNEVKIQNSAKITGSNSIAALTVNSADNSTGLGGKQITFTAATTQTISGTLTLKGSSTTSRLQLRSSSTGNQWKINCGSSDIKFVDIKDAKNESSDFLFALNSNDSGNNTKWNFPGMEYTWTGATTVAGKQNDWNTATNWSPASIPGIGAKVTIAATTNHPILTQLLNLIQNYGSTEYKGEITVVANAVFDLADYSLKVGEITNNGTLKLKGTSTQKIVKADGSTPAAMSNGTSENSTIEYYDDGIVNLFWNNNQYKNLIISGQTTYNNPVSVVGTTTIKAGPGTGTGKTVSLNSSTNVFTGTVQLGFTESGTTTSAGNVTLNGTGASGAAITLGNNIDANNLTLNSNVRGTALIFKTPLVFNATSITATTTVKFTDSISGTAAPLSITANTETALTSGKTISVPLNITGTLTNTGTTTFNADVSVSGNVTDSGSWTQASNSLIFTGAAAQAFTPNGATTYHSINIAKTGGSFTTATNALTAENFTDTSSPVNVSSITFSTNTTIKSDVTLNTTQPVNFTVGKTYIFQDASNAYKNFTHTAGSTVLNGTISANDISLADSTGTTLTIQTARDINISGTTATTIGTLNVVTASNITFAHNTAITTFTDQTTTTCNYNFNAGGYITAAGGQTFNTTGTVTFGNEATDAFVIGSSDAPQNLTHTAGNTVIIGSVTAADISLAVTTGGPITLIGANITLSQNLTSTAAVTVTNSGLFTLSDAKTLTFVSSFTQNGTGNSILSGNFGSGTGIGTASFGTAAAPVNVQLNPSAAATFGDSDDTISISGNLILSKGTITAKADINVSKDFLIFGSNYSETDSSTSITDEYSYMAQRPSAWSQRQYTANTLPDGTAISTASTWTSILKVDSGKSITVGKNFYANGTTLSETAGTGTWNLKLPDLTNAANGFAEAYHSVVKNCIVSCTDTSDPATVSNGAKARLVALECNDAGTDSNTNVDFDNFHIEEAYTVRDNAIYVRFNRPVRYHAGTISSLKFNDNTSAPNGSFTGLYSDADCQTELNFDTQITYFYIKAEPRDSATIGAWNTDATGTSAGLTNSSDRFGVHHENKPCLDFPRALSQSGSTPTISFILTDRWGKRLNNYSKRNDATGQIPLTTAEPAYGTNETAGSETYVLDRTGPVLWTVRTGQELHEAYDASTGETSQHSYDSHNFLEFRYSEPVDFGSTDTSICDISIPAYSAGTTPNVTENIQVTDRFGAVSGSVHAAASTMVFTGLTSLTATAAEPLQLYTGSNGSPNKYVNALYRTDEYSLRLSVAGWTDGTVTDYAGNDFKKWPGYIEEAKQFTGATAHTVSASNSLVKDQAGNVQIEYLANKVEPIVRSNSTQDNPSNLLPVTAPAAAGDLYSEWDLSAPVFAPLRFSKDTEWGNQEMSESIGNTNGSGSTLDRIDFHFFDNSPEYDSSDPAEWFTEIGWCTPGSEASKDNLKDADYTYCADIIGGARQFDSDADRRTTGGIRFSTKTDSATAFRYSTNPDELNPETNFRTGVANIYTTIISQLFTGSSAPMRPANDPDGLYLGIGITDSNLSVETTFAFSYNEGQGYITDLAGNRLRSKVSKTIDRTPPSFDVVFSPVDTKSVYIIFVKKLITDSAKLKLRDNSGVNIPITESYTSLIPKCFRIISIDENGEYETSSENQIDTSIPAQIIEANSNKSFTCIKLTTTNDINIENIKSLYLQLIMPSEYPDQTSDPFTNNINSRVTLIQDSIGNYMSMFCAHSLSDFAINYINPLYAYSSDMMDNGTSVMDGLYEEGSWAVHDWNADQQNYGTLPAAHPISIVADTKGNNKIRVFLSPSPDADSISSQFNHDFDKKLRVWLPEVTDGLFRALSSSNNTNYVYSDGYALNGSADNTIFDISKETVSAWKSGTQISFMFGLTKANNAPLRIYNNPYYDVATDRFNLSLSIPVPLYSLRMHDTNDINSLDLWSFKVRKITEQRGGVTILNNVINASKGEKTVVKVDLPEEGRLNVIVMTLDGNIISYLNRGNTKAGEHYFTWNGKNKSGKAVARGMYFIRVTGSGIDETRKVMVVKD